MNRHEDFIRRCFQLAQRARGLAAPNPMVGAVLVHNGRILAEGYHAAYGQRHAEAVCLDAVREDERHLVPESTLYVSLEPCAHWGKQPPCADRLVAERVGAVCVSNADPFAAVDGRGFRKLQDAGIPVTTGVLEAEGRWVNRRFFTFHEKQRPYIVLKWAETADGFLAPTTRERTAISSPLAQRLVHRWRTEEAAILVGTATARHDDPQLTARLWEGPQPLRLVLDRRLELPRSLRLFDGAAETWQVNELEENAAAPVRRVRVPGGAEALPALLRRLYDAGKQSLLVEGGAAVLQAFLQAGLWDEARVFSAPQALGQGVVAPQLLGAVGAGSWTVGADVLRLFVHPESGFVRPEHAEL